MRQLQSGTAHHHRPPTRGAAMNEGDYWTIVLADAAAPGDDPHFLDNRSDAFCEAALTDTLTDWAHQ
jgi:hypothetical protein